MEVIDDFLPSYQFKELQSLLMGMDFPCSTTAILYINTNNGYTKFKKGGKVKSVANRMLIFDSQLEHAGVTCTDALRRVVVNFNYD